MSVSAILKTLLILVLSLPLIAVLLMLEKTPAVTTAGSLSAEDLETVQNFIINNDPRALLRGQNRIITVSEVEAEALLAYFVSQTDEFSTVAGDVSLSEGLAELRLTIPVDAAFLGQYLNITITLDDSDSPAHIVRFDLGALHLPDALITPVLSAADRRLADNADYRLLLSLLNSIENLTLTAGQAVFSLQLDNEQLSSASSVARDIIFTPPEQSRVVDYYALIMATEQAILDEGNTRASLNRYLQPMFMQAYDRVLDGEDPAMENRALFLALSVYLTGLELNQVTAQTLEESMSGHVRRVRVTLNGRLDLAQHLVTSAAIASTSGSGVTRLISVYKEVIDSRTRSGFSFDDMTANAVGTALGELGMETQSVAHRLQFVLKDVNDEGYYMPAASNDPTLSEAEFQAAYGNRDSAAWEEKLASIEQEIMSRPLFDTFGRSVSLSGPIP